MAQTQHVLPGRIQEIRYAQNLADFAFNFAPSPVPLDLSVRTVGVDGWISAPLSAAVQISGTLLLIHLTANQMRQVYQLPKSLVYLEIKWAGLVQIIVEVRAALTGIGPDKAAITVPLPAVVTYAITPELASQTATSAAGQALASKVAAAESAADALNSKNTAVAKAGEASASAADALISKNTATTKAGEASASAANALTSKNTATTKAGEASASAADALTSKNTATTKAGEASASAADALTSKNTATTKAGEASASAADALASKNTSVTKAGEASASAVVAAEKAQQAVDLVGNVLAFVSEEAGVSVTMGIGTSIQTVDHLADQFPSVTITFLD